MHADFRWPTAADGEHMFTWDADGDDDDADFVGMHGDEMCGGVDEDADEEEADRQADSGGRVPAVRARRLHDAWHWLRYFIVGR